MKLGEIAGISIRCSPLVILLTLLCAVSGRISELITAALALSLHEICHTSMALSLGCRVSTIELMPFGFVAELTAEPNTLWDEIAIAAAGPLFSIIAGISCTALADRFPGAEYIRSFAAINTGIAAINLLPALPLDGGRLLRAALSAVLPPKLASRIAIFGAITLGAICIVLGALMIARGEFNITVPIFGLFLLMGAISEFKKLQELGLHRVLKRCAALRSGSSVAVRCIAINKHTTAREALRLFDSSRYTVLLVVDDDMSAMFELDEMALLYGASAHNTDLTLEGLASHGFTGIHGVRKNSG
ncbi:MAG: M50 family metallopeptidase [Clostridia bacterium]